MLSSLLSSLLMLAPLLSEPTRRRSFRTIPRRGNEFSTGFPCTNLRPLFSGIKIQRRRAWRAAGLPKLVAEQEQVEREASAYPGKTGCPLFPKRMCHSRRLEHVPIPTERDMLQSGHGSAFGVSL